MYCPRCGQQQVSEQQRFCPRCGFALGGVAELVAAGGVSASHEEAGARRRSPRYEGVRQGIILLMLSAVLLPLVDVVGQPYHEALIFVFLIAGVMRMIYALTFQEGAARQAAGESGLRAPESTEATIGGGSQGPALPQGSGVPVTEFGRRRGEPAEYAPRPSVTENTTRLLDDQSEG